MGKRRRRRSSESWWTASTGGMVHWLIVASAAVLVVGGVAVGVAATNRPAVIADSTSVPRPTSTYLQDIPTFTPIPEVKVTIPDDPRILIVGDSFVEGAQATAKEKGFAYLTADALGWPSMVDGVGYTGYVNPGDAGEDRRYGTRALADIEEFAPNVILLAGGQNDYRATNEELRAAVTATVNDIRGAAPDAAIILLGPTRGGTQNSTMLRMARVIHGGASDAGVPFIDPVDPRDWWFTRENSGDLIAADETHPNDAGHAYMAERLMAALREVVTNPEALPS